MRSFFATLFFFFKSNKIKFISKSVLKNTVVLASYNKQQLHNGGMHLKSQSRHGKWYKCINGEDPDRIYAFT